MSETHSVTDAPRLLTAISSLPADLRADHLLRSLVEAACGLVDARYGALGVLDAEGTGLSDFIWVGLETETAEAIGELPRGKGLLGKLIIDPHPLRLEHLNQHPESAGFPAHHPPMDSFLGVPVRLGDRVFGNLYLTDKTTAPEFTKDDEDLVSILATAAAALIENAQLNSRLTEMALVEDRERIARDLHDTVIQRLFATGLTLQSTARMIGDPDLSKRLQESVNDLDETIRQIRTSIFELESSRLSHRTTHGELLDIVSRARGGLGFAPKLDVHGPLDTAATDGRGENLLATVEEALSNIARHAGATEASVIVEVEASQIKLVVTDNGRGYDPTASPGKGLKNMADRATRLGGSFTIDQADSTGTKLEWRIPLT